MDFNKMDIVDNKKHYFNYLKSSTRKLSSNIDLK